MPKKQKRFKSEQAILRAIDAMEARRADRLKAAEDWEASIKRMRLEDYPSEKEYTAEKDYRRKMIGVCERSAKRSASKKVELGKALAGFRTILLPLDGNEDTSVVL